MKKGKLIIDGETFDVDVNITCIQTIPKSCRNIVEDGHYVYDDYVTYCFEGYWTEVQRYRKEK